MVTSGSLFLAHQHVARGVAAEFFLPGYDRDDVHQEALVGLWDASRCWRPDGGASFPTFAKHVIRRHLIERLRFEQTLGRRAHLEAVRDIEINTDDGETTSLLELLPDRRADTVELVIQREELATYLRALPRLSPLEREGLGRVVNGVPYRGDKRIDNAVQRARAKLLQAAA